MVLFFSAICLLSLRRLAPTCSYTYSTPKVDFVLPILFYHSCAHSTCLTASGRTAKCKLLSCNLWCSWNVDCTFRST